MVKEYINVDVCVEAIRFKGNGTIFTGAIINSAGVQSGKEVVVRCTGNVLSPRSEVFRGEVWEVEGFQEIYRGRIQLGATKAVLKRPTGENIIAALAFNPNFSGIGEKKARELWRVFGLALYDLLDGKEPMSALHQVLTPETTKRLVHVWNDEYSSELYQWLDQYQIPVRISRRLQGYYGKDARAKLEGDPYRILAFGEKWQTVDGVARRFGIAEDDPRRLHAAVAEVLYRRFAEGHTATPTDVLTKQVAWLLGSKEENGLRLACNALKLTYTDGAFVRTYDVWQPTGVFLIEAFVADRIHRMLARQNTQGNLFDSVVKQIVNSYEETQHLISNEQRAAVDLALKNACCIITGGAGVGKTTVLYCIHNSVEEMNGAILQMALSGRAAKRMEEASRRPAMTIAGFLTKIKQEDLKSVTHVVIDEASMLDIVSTFQILKKLPERIKLILMGDPYQLPPIGPGLTFHVLAEAKGIPVARLTKVFRQSGESGIPTISNCIRNGSWPHIPKYNGKADGVFAYQSRPEKMAERLIQIYDELGGVEAPAEEVQILSPTKADNPYGVAGINRVFHARYTEGENPVLTLSKTDELEDSGFRQGDRILVTENQWHRHLYNGSLGYIKEAFRTPRHLGELSFTVAKAVIDGREIQLTQDDLRWLVYGYSISVHKAQGSQFKRVIIPICKSRLLDRTLIYTAVTRGVNQVVLLGDLSAAKAAVEAPPFAWRRQIGLDRLVRGNVVSV